MTQITAAMVMELREQTGAGMMDVKSALTEANGNMEEATKILRKKGLAAAGKKAGRVTSEGVVQAYTSGNVGVLVRAYCYIRTYGPAGLKAVAENAVLNANYLLARLKHILPVPHGDRCQLALADGRAMDTVHSIAIRSKHE